MTAAQEMFQAADKIQHKPLTDAQWSDAVECYQRAKLMTDAVNDLVKAFAEQTKDGGPSFTPGPWELVTVQTSCGICHKIGPFPSKREGDSARHACLYADYPSKGNPADDELEANARLISAAPDMYEALKALTDLYIELANSGDCGFWDPEKQPEIISAHAALAKAEGK